MKELEFNMKVGESVIVAKPIKGIGYVIDSRFDDLFICKMADTTQIPCLTIDEAKAACNKHWQELAQSIADMVYGEDLKTMRAKIVDAYEHFHNTVGDATLLESLDEEFDKLFKKK